MVTFIQVQRNKDLYGALKINRKFTKILLYKSTIIGGPSITPSPKPLHKLGYNLLKHLGQWHDLFAKLCNLKTGLSVVRDQF